MRSLKPVFLGMESHLEFVWPSELVIGVYSLGPVPNEWLMQLVEVVTLSGGGVDIIFCALENSYVGWEKRRREYNGHIMTDLPAPTTNFAVFDDVIGASQSAHLPIICVTNFPRLSSRNKGPIRLDASKRKRRESA